jgi:hypothetical protein
MASEYVVDFGRLPKGIVDGQDGTAGYPGDGTDALAFEQANGDLGASESFSHGVFLWVGGSTGGLQKQNPRRIAPAGVGVLCCFCLPDPRRRVRNDACYDHAHDDRFHQKGSGRTEGMGCVHWISGRIGKKLFENYE